MIAVNPRCGLLFIDFDSGVGAVAPCRNRCCWDWTQNAERGV